MSRGGGFLKCPVLRLLSMGTIGSFYFVIEGKFSWQKTEHLIVNGSGVFDVVQ